jgi:phage terminase large subunit
MNPATKEHWVYKRFFEETGVPYDFNGRKGNVRYIHTTYLDNIENLSQKFIDRALVVKGQNEEKYNHVYMGKWADRAEGVIFTNWKPQTFDEGLVNGYGLDFGFSESPDALVWVAIDKKRMRIYLKQHIYENGLNTADLTAKIHKKIWPGGIIYADSSEPRLISELKTAGLRIVEAYKPPGSVSAGIKIMQDYLLCIDPDSLDLMKELNYYQWKEKGEIPADKWNHLLDAARYYVMHQLGGGRTRTKAY